MPPSDGRLLPEDLVFELDAPPEWVEESRWHLPCHVRVRDGSWFVLVEDLHVWESAWELATRERVAS
jgi:hypothetical protein